MSKIEPEGPLQPEAANIPDVKRKHAGGRPPKELITLPVQSLIDLTAPVAARLLQRMIDRDRGYTKLSRDLIEACKFVIDHAVGKARQKIEHSGGALTYRELVNSASDIERSGRDILAEVEEIANKTAGAPPENGSI